jgi:HK97 family phage portal protein
MRWPFAKRKPLETRDAPLAVLASAYGGWRAPGAAISPQAAEALGAVRACVSLIANSISALPVALSVDSENGRTSAPPNAAALRLLRQPTAHLTWPPFMQWGIAQLLMHGNMLAAVESDGAGRPSALRPVPWQNVVVSMLADERLVFDVNFPVYPFAPAGPPKRYLQGEVLFVRMRSRDGLTGQSVLAASGPMAELREIETLARSMWANGLRPSAVLTAPNFLTPEQRKRKTEWIEEFSGAINSGRVPLLEGGWELKPASINSTDAEFLQTRAHNIGDICRAFAVPEALLQTAGRELSDTAPHLAQFAALCLQPLVTTFQTEFDAAVLPAGQHIEIDLTSLLRSDFSKTTAALAALVAGGIISPNEARQELQWAPRPDAEALRQTPSPNWPADFAGGDHLGASPGPRGDQPPAPNTNQGAGRRGNGAAAAMQ